MQTEQLARKGNEYSNNMMAMTRERMKLQFDAEIQIILAKSPYTTSTFSIHDDDYEAKMKYLCRIVLDRDMQAAMREDPEQEVRMRKTYRKRRLIGTRELRTKAGMCRFMDSQGDQYAYAMTWLIDAQQTLLVAMESGLGGSNINEQIAHAYTMLCLCVNAVAQLREQANAPRKLRGVA
ncbi:MAG: hypothetical protein EZS28_020129 [Streblomastix strix]|uniref:Uncharacterized protein n=1 Tax=Streblomastix strix TaxID=222440 RepID=A0A5J4VPD7_9EUKA|nr:MAG: hypothetical protein EZS28_020129 [Streblomastix strix]